MHKWKEPKILARAHLMQTVAMFYLIYVEGDFFFINFDHLAGECQIARWGGGNTALLRILVHNVPKEIELRSFWRSLMLPLNKMLNRIQQTRPASKPAGCV